jgi:sulfur carrier protein
MMINLNRNKESFEHEELTINQLLVIKNYTFKFLVVTINGKIIKKEEYDYASVRNGDDVNIIHLISGG